MLERARSSQDIRSARKTWGIHEERVMEISDTQTQDASLPHHTTSCPNSSYRYF